MPLGANLDLILRYETTIQGQLAYAISQLERLRRARKREQVPALLFAALSFLEDLDHGGGGNNSGGFVLFQGEEFLVAGH